MKKNWEIIRTILIRLEDSDTPNTVINAKDVSEYSEQEVAYNMRLLNEGEFIEAKILESKNGSGLISIALATRLTNKGHELLEIIRNDSVWSKIKNKFKSSGVDMTFDLVLSIGKNVMKSLLIGIIE
ncbi:MAG TPA: DUF2513 domain-containing protein [Thiotrichaceae bacterium]|nr:DUF2513 domain-containing protein [Thiotrichaceae bacterium]